MSKPEARLNARIERFIRADARGEPHKKLLKEFFNVDENSTPKEKNRAEQQIFRWRHRSDYETIWQDEIRGAVRRHVPVSLDRIKIQVDSDTEWLANKAANDVISLASRIGVIKTEDTAMQVQIQGMPDIGSPDDNV